MKAAVFQGPGRGARRNTGDVIVRGGLVALRGTGPLGPGRATGTPGPLRAPGGPQLTGVRVPGPAVAA